MFYLWVFLCPSITIVISGFILTFFFIKPIYAQQTKRLFNDIFKLFSYNVYYVIYGKYDFLLNLVCILFDNRYEKIRLKSSFQFKNVKFINSFEKRIWWSYFKILFRIHFATCTFTTISNSFVLFYLLKLFSIEILSWPLQSVYFYVVTSLIFLKILNSLTTSFYIGRNTLFYIKICC